MADNNVSRWFSRSLLCFIWLASVALTKLCSCRNCVLEDYASPTLEQVSYVTRNKEQLQYRDNLVACCIHFSRSAKLVCGFLFFFAQVALLSYIFRCGRRTVRSRRKLKSHCRYISPFTLSRCSKVCRVFNWSDFEIDSPPGGLHTHQRDHTAVKEAG